MEKIIFKPGNRVILLKDYAPKSAGDLATVGPKGIYTETGATWVDIIWDTGDGAGGWHIEQFKLVLSQKSKPKPRARTRLEDLIL